MSRLVRRSAPIGWAAAGAPGRAVGHAAVAPQRPSLRVAPSLLGLRDRRPPRRAGRVPALAVAGALPLYSRIVFRAAARA